MSSPRQGSGEHGSEFGANKRPAHQIRNARLNECVGANVERGSRKEYRLYRADAMKRVRQLEGPPDGGDADQYGVKTGGFATERGDGVGWTVETDWLVSERCEDLLVAEQTVAVIVNKEHGFPSTKTLRRNGLASPRR